MKSSLFSIQRKILNFVKNVCFKIIAMFLCIYKRGEEEEGGEFTKISRRNELMMKKKLPEPSGLPIFGTLFEFIRRGSAPKLHEYISYRHESLGKIFCERLGGNFKSPCVFVSDTKLMRKVFQFEGRTPRHPLPESWQIFNEKHKTQRGLLFMEGDEWLHNRRILSPLLLGSSLEWIDDHIMDCTGKLVEKWRENVMKQQQVEGKSYHVENVEFQLYRWAVDVNCTIMFGSYPAQRQDINAALNEFSVIVRNIFEASSALMTFPPKLAQVCNLKIWRNFEEAVTEVLEKSTQIIELFMNLQERLDDDVSEFKSKDSLYKKLKEDPTMSPETIKRIFTDLVIAAGDTTAYTAEWALYLLSSDASLQAKITQEALNVNSYKESPLISGLLKETLRLYPVAPFIGRYLETDATIGNYEIKKDTLTLLSLYTAGRDSEQFPDALKVDPERWLERKANEITKLYGTLPFAIGARSCIGRKVATNQILCLLYELLRNFELQCVNEEPIKSILRLVTVPEVPLKLRIELRSK